jgi:hypothetical protein
MVLNLLVLPTLALRYARFAPASDELDRSAPTTPPTERVPTVLALTPTTEQEGKMVEAAQAYRPKVSLPSASWQGTTEGRKLSAKLEPEESIG